MIAALGVNAGKCPVLRIAHDALGLQRLHVPLHFGEVVVGRFPVRLKPEAGLLHLVFPHGQRVGFRLMLGQAGGLVPQGRIDAHDRLDGLTGHGIAAGVDFLTGLVRDGLGGHLRNPFGTGLGVVRVRPLHRAGIHRRQITALRGALHVILDLLLVRGRPETPWGIGHAASWEKPAPAKGAQVSAGCPRLGPAPSPSPPRPKVSQPNPDCGSATSSPSTLDRGRGFDCGLRL